MVNNSVNVLALLLVLMLKALTKIVGYNESELNGSEQCKEKWHLSAKMPLLKNRQTAGHETVAVCLPLDATGVAICWRCDVVPTVY